MITRRGFLGALAAAALAPRQRGLCLEGASPVWVSRDPPDKAIPTLLSASPAATRHLVEGARVLVKPNLSWANPPDWATTTDPAVLRAVVGCCLDRGASSVVIVDHPLGEPSRCLARTGAADAVRGLPRVRVVMLDRQRDFVSCALPTGSTLAQVEIARDLLDTTCIVNLPKAKAHGSTTVSLGLKNLMGLVADRGVFHRGGRLHRCIAELLHVVRPHLTIVDAVSVLTSRGPQGPGSVQRPRVLALGEDPVALDAYACTLARWDGRVVQGRDVGHIASAEDLGFGSSRFTPIPV